MFIKLLRFLVWIIWFFFVTCNNYIPLDGIQGYLVFYLSVDACVATIFYLGHNFWTIKERDFIFASLSLWNPFIRPFSSSKDTTIQNLDYNPRKRSLVGYIGITLSVRLSVCPSVQNNLNLDHNFLSKGDRALILHKCIPCDKTFLSIPKFLTLWPWPWLLTYFWKNLTLAIAFWTKGDRAFIFHMCISCGKTFLLEQKIFTSRPWPWLLTLLFEKT